MKPEVGDDFIKLPITLDYKGGRGAHAVFARNVAIVLILCYIAFAVIFFIKGDFPVLVKIGIVIGVFIVLLRFSCLALFRERYYKRIYQRELDTDGEVDPTTIWSIFDIDAQYPYLCYFRNGRKGIFVKMERGTITGKGEDAPYYHYEAISDAYNIAHSASLNIIHIDYMTGLGKDSRIDRMIDEAQRLENEDMRDLMLEIYDNLNEEIAVNYSCFDVYLFLAKKVGGFFDSVQTVCERMITQGGNYVSYSCMPRDEVSTLCKDIFNLESFDSIAVSKELVNADKRAITPIKVINPDGTEEILGLTTKQREEKAKQREAEMRAKREQEEILKALKKKKDDKNLIDF